MLFAAVAEVKSVHLIYTNSARMDKINANIAKYVELAISMGGSNGKPGGHALPVRGLVPTAPTEIFDECKWTPGIKNLVIICWF